LEGEYEAYIFPESEYVIKDVEDYDIGHVWHDSSSLREPDVEFVEVEVQSEA